MTGEGWRRLLWTLWFLLVAVVAASAQGGADTLDLPLPHGADVPGPVEVPGGVSLDFPAVVEYGVDYDETTGQYIVRQRLEDTLDFETPRT